MALEARVAQRNRVAETLAEAALGVARSRREFTDRLGDPDTAARTGALVELERDRLHRETLLPQWERAEADVEAGRQEFLTRRTERQQAETLLEQERQAAARETARRAQQMLDDWFGRRIGALRERGEPPGSRGLGAKREPQPSRATDSDFGAGPGGETGAVAASMNSA